MCVGCFLLLFGILQGCATVTESSLLGIGTGAAVGAIGANALHDSQNKGQAVLTSALISAAIGGIAGYATYQGLEKRDADVRRDTLFNLEKFGVSGFYGSDPISTTANGQNIFLLPDDSK